MIRSLKQALENTGIYWKFSKNLFLFVLEAELIRNDLTDRFFTEKNYFLCKYFTTFGTFFWLGRFLSFQKKD